ELRGRGRAVPEPPARPRPPCRQCGGAAPGVTRQAPAGGRRGLPGGRKGRGPVLALFSPPEGEGQGGAGGGGARPGGGAGRAGGPVPAGAAPASRTSGAFTGWLREGRGRWRPAAQGATYDETLTLLLKVKVEGTAVDRVVLATGRDPNAEAGPR